MKQIGRERQVLAVTHLPQVAACADHHFVVSKTARAGTTTSAVEPVVGEARVAEIARMLGGEKLSSHQPRPRPGNARLQRRPAPRQEGRAMTSDPPGVAPSDPNGVGPSLSEGGVGEGAALPRQQPASLRTRSCWSPESRAPASQ